MRGNNAQRPRDRKIQLNRLLGGSIANITDRFNGGMRSRTMWIFFTRVAFGHLVSSVLMEKFGREQDPGIEQAQNNGCRTCLPGHEHGTKVMSAVRQLFRSIYSIMKCCVIARSFACTVIV